mmetsp:Transcript_9356/g.28148  ORF Transcript_9356/g.28148 Transcript_9356/m.28148 type:complete len:1012 (-) Transcript_9356:263-3298(-)
MLQQCSTYLRRAPLVLRSARNCRTFQSRRIVMELDPAVQKVTVRSSAKDEKMTITLHINGQQRNLTRDKIEAVENPLRRIQMSAVPGKTGKAKKARKGQTPPSSPTGPPLPRIRLLQGSTIDSPMVETYVKNEDAWAHGRLLLVGKQQFIVDRNPPTVEKVEVIGDVLVDCPVLANATLAFADDAATMFTWQRIAPTASSQVGSGGDSSPKALDLPETSCVYTPVQADVGCKLRVLCTPVTNAAGGREGRRGAPVDVTVGPVMAGPGRDTPTARRHALTQAAVPAEQGFRLVTYNLLADQYASSDKGKTKLFAYCPTRFLSASYRWPLIIAELLGFNADVICLQEVDARAFSAFFKPHLRAAGFNGTYTNKVGKTHEGCAMFWRRSRFAATAKRDVDFRKFFASMRPESEATQKSPRSSDDGSSGSGSNAFGADDVAPQLLPMLEASPHLVDSLQRVGTIAQMVVLRAVQARGEQSSSGKGAAAEAATAGLCVLNTHLFYHPQAPHIRTMHTAALMAAAHTFLRQLSQPGGSSTPRPSVVFCGDLNSDLNEGIPGVVELLRSGRVAEDFWDWREGQDFSFGRGRADAAVFTAQADAAELASPDDSNGELEETHASAAASPRVSVPSPSPPAATPAPPSPAATSPAAVSPTAGSSPPSAMASSNPASRGFGARLLSDIEREKQQRQAQAKPPVPATTRPAVVGVDLTIPFHLAPADGLVTEFTNYVRGYRGFLDYVWHEPDRMHAARQVPLPTRADVQAYMPSEIFPSDHMSVVFDMAWGPSPTSTDGSGDGSSDEAQPLPAKLPQIPAALIALQSGVIAIPTDTLYGFACPATSAAGIEAIYRIKGRQASAPLAVCLADVWQVGVYGEAAHLPAGLLRALLPGPVTVVLKRRPDAPLAAQLNPGVGTLGIRIPNHGFVRDLCRGVGGALALTSANPSGAPSALEVTDFQQLWPSCSAVFDGGPIPTSARDGSCIVDLTDPKVFRILREGNERAYCNAIDMLKLHGMQSATP